MTNIHLDERSAHDIDEKISRVHRDLGYRGGAINLAEVRDLLSLDLQFYAAADPSLLEEVIHKLRVGAKQVVRRPGLLLDAIKKFELKALFLPDRKRILISADLPNLKRRWSEGHEIAHSLIPWHEDYMLGDDRSTLSLNCHELIEAEANYGSGRLLFPAGVFHEVRRAQPVNLERVRAIALHFGNTITTTLWRCVESDDNPSFAAIGSHPHFPEESQPVVEHFVRSKAFAERFSAIANDSVARRLKEYCSFERRGTLGTSEIIVEDDAGVEHVFIAESFHNSYDVLTLAQYLRPRHVFVSV